VLVVDDLLATGGTAAAAAVLVESVGAEVAGLAFVIELSGLGGREKLGERQVQSLVLYTED
jgi:adenine phosphoribosyltransferase